MTRTSLLTTLLIGVMVGLFYCPSAQAQVYKKVLEDGTVVYTDKKQAGAEEIQVESVVSEFEPVKRADDTDAIASETEVASSANENGPVQANIEIISPANEATIRSNEGNVTVTWAAQTRNVKGPLNYKLSMDNQIAYEGKGSGVTLGGLNRGEHTLVVRVFDDLGTLLATSEPVVFYLHQASIYNPALNSGGVNQGGTSGQN